MTVRNNKGKILQFSYGDDNIDPTKVENQSVPLTRMSLAEIYAHFQIPEDSSKLYSLLHTLKTRQKE